MLKKYLFTHVFKYVDTQLLTNFKESNVLLEDNSNCDYSYLLDTFYNFHIFNIDNFNVTTIKCIEDYVIVAYTMKFIHVFQIDKKNKIIKMVKVIETTHEVWALDGCLVEKVENKECYQVKVSINGKYIEVDSNCDNYNNTSESFLKKNLTKKNLIIIYGGTDKFIHHHNISTGQCFSKRFNKNIIRDICIVENKIYVASRDRTLMACNLNLEEESLQMLSNRMDCRSIFNFTFENKLLISNSNNINQTNNITFFGNYEGEVYYHFNNKIFKVPHSINDKVINILFFSTDNTVTKKNYLIISGRDQEIVVLECDLHFKNRINPLKFTNKYLIKLRNINDTVHSVFYHKNINNTHSIIVVTVYGEILKYNLFTNKVEYSIVVNKSKCALLVSVIKEKVIENINKQLYNFNKKNKKTIIKTSNSVLVAGTINGLYVMDIERGRIKTILLRNRRIMRMSDYKGNTIIVAHTDESEVVLERIVLQ